MFGKACYGARMHEYAKSLQPTCLCAMRADDGGAKERSFRQKAARQAQCGGPIKAEITEANSSTHRNASIDEATHQTCDVMCKQHRVVGNDIGAIRKQGAQFHARVPHSMRKFRRRQMLDAELQYLSKILARIRVFPLNARRILEFMVVGQLLEIGTGTQHVEEAGIGMHGSNPLRCCCDCHISKKRTAMSGA